MTDRDPQADDARRWFDRRIYVIDPTWPIKRGLNVLVPAAGIPVWVALLIFIGLLTLCIVG